jgi:hypothetical protein
MLVQIAKRIRLPFENDPRVRPDRAKLERQLCNSSNGLDAWNRCDARYQLAGPLVEPIHRRVFEGLLLTRDIPSLIVGAGFRIERVQRVYCPDFQSHGALVAGAPRGKVDSMPRARPD